MSRAKVFKVIGEIQKPNLSTSFTKEVITVKPEQAVEKVYTELGSKHRAKRFQIKIHKVEEVPLDKIENPLLKKLVEAQEIGE